MRIFIAIDISDEAKKEVEKLYKVLKKKHWKVKWEPIEKLHFTLAFLGSIKYQTSNIKKIKKAIELVSEDIGPFTLSFKGLGCFPDYIFPRVIWLGLRGDLKSLAALQKNIVRELSDSELFDSTKYISDRAQKRTLKGFEKPFSPHITLGRVKKEVRAKERREIGKQLNRFRILNLEPKISADRVVIYESKLLPTGSVYTKLSEIPLK